MYTMVIFVGYCNVFIESNLNALPRIRDLVFECLV